MSNFTILATSGLAAWLAVSVASDLVPVTAFMRAEPVERTATEYTARVTGRKLRECIVVGGTFVGWARGGDLWKEVPLEFINDATPDDSRPAGRQDFGLWRWQTPPNATRVKATVQHNCAGSVRITTVGPFNLKQP